MNKLCPEKMYIPTLVVLVFLDFLGTKRNFITFTHTKNKSTYAMHYLPKQLSTYLADQLEGILKLYFSS